MSQDIATDLPEVATAKQLAAFLQQSEASLAQDRYLRQGVPFIRIGRRIRYLKSDVQAYLSAARDNTHVSEGPG